ncbi:MAG: neutral/alkaline non-lysosomal ceramidase N-terminal domain-containing protein [Planctomycetaceae bacterium]|nr:neutral/alkaline non-lysosomal ceramidase N-terminal domain-containing protein [Planctomycetaceae bacterium]
MAPRFLTVLCAIFACSSSAVWGGELSAGVARVDLTPPLSMKAPLGGYGARMNRPAEGVHDRLFAKALVLSDGNRRFALVTCDLLGLASPMKPEIVSRLGDDWSAEQILILPSHSHGAIEMNAMNPNNVFSIPQIGIHDPALYDLTVNRFVDVIRRAADSLEPVTVGTRSRNIPGWNRNRRGANGLTDDELTVTRIDSTTGRPVAVLVNFTAHPTFMTDKQMQFSGDWPGALQRTLETVVGDGVTAMYYNGAEGDQAPVSRPSAGDSRWEMADQYGLELGLLAGRFWGDIATSSEVTFDFHQESIELPERRWHPDFMSTGGKEYGLSEDLLRDMLPRMSPEQTTSGSLRLGELVIVGVPGEMSAELGLHIKSEAKRITGAAHPVIGGLANEWISYILTPEAYRTGGYEASVSFYGEELGSTITRGALTGVGRLRP